MPSYRSGTNSCKTFKLSNKKMHVRHAVKTFASSHYSLLYIGNNNYTEQSHAYIW